MMMMMMIIGEVQTQIIFITVYSPIIKCSILFFNGVSKTQRYFTVGYQLYATHINKLDILLGESTYLGSLTIKNLI